MKPDKTTAEKTALSFDDEINTLISKHNALYDKLKKAIEEKKAALFFKEYPIKEWNSINDALLQGFKAVFLKHANADKVEEPHSLAGTCLGFLVPFLEGDSLYLEEYTRKLGKTKAEKDADAQAASARRDSVWGLRDSIESISMDWDENPNCDPQEEGDTWKEEMQTARKLCGERKK